MLRTILNSALIFTCSEAKSILVNARALNAASGGPASGEIARLKEVIVLIAMQLEGIGPLRKRITENSPLSRQIAEIPEVARAVILSEDMSKELEPLRKQIGVPDRGT